MSSAARSDLYRSSWIPWGVLSGLRESNPRWRLGRPQPDHSAKPAEMQKPAGFRVAGFVGRTYEEIRYR